MKPEDRWRGPGGDRGCPGVRRWLQVYLDDEIQDEAMVMRLAAHLDLCQKCRHEARTFSELKSCLRRLQPPADPEALRRLHDFLKTLDEPLPPFPAG